MSSTAMDKAVECTAPINIALVKYWGKRDQELHLPANSSLSITLDTKDLYTKMHITASNLYSTTTLNLNGKEEPIPPRMQKVIGMFSKLSASSHRDWHLRIISHNSFPTAAGLASSASAYSCLVMALSKLYEMNMSLEQLSCYARLGSGSACRSIHSGFAVWEKGTQADGTDSAARMIAPATHWPELRVFICVVDNRKKETPSTLGMARSMQTSEFLKYRVENSVAEKRIAVMEQAILDRDFPTVAQLAMQDSNQFHAICLDTSPPISYLNAVSFEIIQLVHRWNTEAGQIVCGYTFDAGPNAFLLCLESHSNELLEKLSQNIGICSAEGGEGRIASLIATQAGKGASLV